MKLGRLNHIGVATPSIADSIAFYRDVMGATKIHTPFDLPEQGVKVCFVDTPGADGAMNGTQIELVEPLGPDSTLAGFIAKNPLGGQHHLCFEVPDIAEARSGIRGDGQAHPWPHADRRARHPYLFRPSQGHGRHAYRNHGNAQRWRPLV